jgi:hypothetical protein
MGKTLILSYDFQFETPNYQGYQDFNFLERTFIYLIASSLRGNETPRRA